MSPLDSALHKFANGGWLPPPPQAKSPVEHSWFDSTFKNDGELLRREQAALLAPPPAPQAPAQHPWLKLDSWLAAHPNLTYGGGGAALGAGIGGLIGGRRGLLPGLLIGGLGGLLLQNVGKTANFGVAEGPELPTRPAAARSILVPNEVPATVDRANYTMDHADRTIGRADQLIAQVEPLLKAMRDAQSISKNPVARAGVGAAVGGVLGGGLGAAGSAAYDLVRRRAVDTHRALVTGLGSMAAGAAAGGVYGAKTAATPTRLPIAGAPKNMGIAPMTAGTPGKIPTIPRAKIPKMPMMSPAPVPGGKTASPRFGDPELDARLSRYDQFKAESDLPYTGTGALLGAAGGAGLGALGAWLYRRATTDEGDIDPETGEHKDVNWGAGMLAGAIPLTALGAALGGNYSQGTAARRAGLQLYTPIPGVTG